MADPKKGKQEETYTFTEFIDTFFPGFNLADLNEPKQDEIEKEEADNG